MDAKRRLRQIQRLLRGRELIYVGSRGTDALPLTQLDSLGYIFSLIAPTRSGVSETCLEDMSKVRVDLNGYSLDDDDSEPAARFREALFARLSRPSAVIPYSPSRTLSRGWLVARDTVLRLGLFYEQQSCFDHKPWVESELGKWGIATIPWTYVRTLPPSQRTNGIADLFDGVAPFVVRWPRSRGGVGVWLVRDQEDLDSVTAPPPGEGIFCVAPYFEAAVSVNVNACAFPEGEVSIHGSSVQLVGIDVCTSLPLGYAGNDFASIKELPIKALWDLDSMTRSVGSWLVRHGYLGAFGLDALVLGNRVLFVELNPRFQASSAVASQLDKALDRPNQYLAHIAAFLGLGAADQLSLPELVKKQEPLSHIMLYNRRDGSVTLQQRPEGRDIRLLPASNAIVKPLATLAALLWNGRVTETGRELRDEPTKAVLELQRFFSPAENRWR
jgi:hypothetical protein